MQKKIADVTFQNETVMVSGDLDFGNVLSLYQKSLQNIAASQSVTIDFSSVTSSNSAGLALIVEWVKFAKQQHKSIIFKHLSSDILALAATAGLNQLITT